MSSRIVIIGGGPGGYESALVAAKAGAQVTLIEKDGIGGSAVLCDVVPSKTIIATAEWRTIADRAPQLGIRDVDGRDTEEFAEHTVDLAAVNTRVMDLVARQSHDIADLLERNGITVVAGAARVVSATEVEADGVRYAADAIILATGARPRVLDTAPVDGERVLSWTDLYRLTEVPEHLIVVGSGVTGAEFASAYRLLGSTVTLVSSRERVLHHEDPEAAEMVQRAFARRGMNVIVQARASAVRATGTGVEVELPDGTVVSGSHCLMAVGSIPNTQTLGLADVGVATDDAGYVRVDKVSRTSVSGIYAAGDCTGVLPLASVAAAQGRIAVAHIVGDAVQPLDLEKVASTVFTSPEIANVGSSEEELRRRGIFYQVSRLDLALNPRAKMLGIDEGFIKVFGHTVTGRVLGAVMVGTRASEHIFPLSVAVANNLTVDQLASSFTVYPSLSGTVAEAARRLHHMRDPNPPDVATGPTIPTS